MTSCSCMFYKIMLETSRNFIIQHNLENKDYDNTNVRSINFLTNSRSRFRVNFLDESFGHFVVFKFEVCR